MFNLKLTYGYELDGGRFTQGCYIADDGSEMCSKVHGHLQEHAFRLAVLNYRRRAA